MLARWTPRTASTDVAEWARSVVGAAAPATPERAKSLLWAAAKLGTFATTVGLALCEETLLVDEVIERFVVVGANEVSPAGRRTLRTNLRALARAGAPVRPAPRPLSRERAKAPYTAAEVAAYLALADAQPPSRRLRASALICLGAGAGLRGGDLRHLRGVDIVARSGAVVVEVRGANPRVVPVLAAFGDRLAAAAADAGEHHVVAGKNPRRHNVVTPLIASLAGGTHLERLDMARLRATWLATVADLIGLPTLLAAAGITCSQRLGDVVATLAPGDEATAVALLGGLR